MKMVMVAYNEAIDEEVMEALEQSGVNSYSKVTATYGRGGSSGTHLGTDIWPGRNNMVYVACGDDEARQILIRIGELRKKLKHEGVKAFVIPLEETI